MHLPLTAEQAGHRERFAAFTAEHVAPFGSEFDRDEAIPRELVKTLGAAGLLCSHIAADNGGPGLDMVSYGLLHHELAHGCSSVRSLLTVHDMVAEAILRLGGAALRDEWLPAMVAGETLAAYALSEPQAGTNVSEIATTATPTDGGVTITGRKRWISFGQLADVFLVIGRQEDGPLGGWLVPKDTPGLTVTPMPGLLGLRGSMLAELEFDGCFVSAEARVGSANLPRGLLTAVTLQLGRYGVAWGSVGIASACRDASLRYSSERQHAGEPIARHQLIKRHITNMTVETRAAALLCHDAGTLLDQRDSRAVQAVLIAKYFASRTATRVAADAVQVHGAMGAIDALPIERHYRDAKIMEIIEGSTEIQQIMIADRAHDEAARQ